MLELDAEIVAAIEEMIEAKASQKEQDLISRVALLDQFIEDQRDSLEERVDTLVKDQGEVETLDAFFQRSIGYSSGV